MGPINNTPALVQIMAWRRSGDMPLSEPMIISLLTLIWVTRPQWVKHGQNGLYFVDKVLQTHYYDRIFADTNWSITPVCSWFNTGSGNGLAPNTWKAITWTNSPIPYRISNTPWVAWAPQMWAPLWGWGTTWEWQEPSTEGTADWQHCSLPGPWLLGTMHPCRVPEICHMGQENFILGTDFRKDLQDHTWNFVKYAFAVIL